MQENTTHSDRFGKSVAIYGNYAIVGAFGYDGGPGGNNAGAVYFTKETVTGNGNSIKTAPNTEKMRMIISGGVSRFMEIMPLSVHLIMILFLDPVIMVERCILPKKS